jgi:hypothetical protein
MNFFKHVGTANGSKKVIIVQRQLPGEEHMAAVIYSEIIPSRFHDDLMKELESEAGQAANEFKEVLERRYFSDGQNMLQVLHGEGWIKKVASNNVIVRPNSKSSIRLDELTKMLAEMRSGRIAKPEAPVEESAMSDQTVTAEQLTAPVAAAPAPDRMDKLEAMMMQMAATVAQLAESQKPAKGRGRPSKSAE